MFRYVLSLMLLIGGYVNAHQFTPTYPELKPSIVDNILQVDMQLFNKRNDVTYYEFQVYDGEWNSLSFATQEKIISIKYLETKNITIYIRSQDKDKVTYICSVSRLKKEDARHTVVTSKICSKIKR